MTFIVYLCRKFWTWSMLEAGNRTWAVKRNENYLLQHPNQIIVLNHINIPKQHHWKTLSLSLSLSSSIKWKFLPNFGDFINVNRGGKIRYEIHKECKVFRLKFSFISVDIVISVYVEMLGLKLAYDNLERQKMRIHQWNFWFSVQILSTVWSMNYSQFTFYSHPPFGLSQKDNRIT